MPQPSSRIHTLCMPLLMALAISFASLAQAKSPTSQPALAISDAAGQLIHPLDPTNAQAIVWIFVIHDCPICNTYAPEFKRLANDYAVKGVKLYLINPEKDFPPAEAKKHAEDYAYPSLPLMDTAHALVKRAGATITPEAVVFSAEGKILYKGRIDDRYVDFGKSRPAATTTDLRNALDAILAGKPVEMPHTRAIGCFIPDEDAGKK